MAERKPKESNYLVYKDKLVLLVARGAVCHDCMTHKICDDLKKQKLGEETPCHEAWKKFLK